MAKSIQRAGDNSKQLIISGDLNVGVTIEEVNQLIELHVDKAKSEFTLEALKSAQEKIESFEKKLAAELNQRGLLGNLRSVGFQQNIFDASRAVAASDSDDSEDFLVKLLIERAKDNKSQSVKIAVSKAIQIADKLDQSSLIGLTAEWVLIFILPTFFDFDFQWNVTRDLQEPFIEAGLPTNKRWQRDLESLDLIKVEPSIMARSRHQELMQRRFAPFLVDGITNEHIDAVKEELDKLNKQLKNLIIPHPLLEGYSMLNASTPEEFSAKLLAMGVSSEDSVVYTLIYMHNFGSTNQIAVDELKNKIADDKVYSEFGKWWDSLSPDRFTSSGEVIGFLNAKRYVSFSADSVSAMFQD